MFSPAAPEPPKPLHAFTSSFHLIFPALCLYCIREIDTKYFSAPLVTIFVQVNLLLGAVQQGTGVLHANEVRNVEAQVDILCSEGRHVVHRQTPGSFAADELVEILPRPLPDLRGLGLDGAEDGLGVGRVLAGVGGGAGRGVQLEVGGQQHLALPALSLGVHLQHHPLFSSYQ